MGVSTYITEFSEISGNASREFSLEQALQGMYGEWDGVEFFLKEYRDTGTHILFGVDDIQVNHDIMAVSARL